MRIGYLSIEDIVPPGFLSRPMSVIVEAGNGMGKTHASSDYAVKLQKIGFLDRVYILQYSQKGCENVVRKIERFGGWCVWHIGLEHFCPFYHRFRHLVAEGIPATLFCYVCEFFRGKQRRAFRFLENEIRRKGVVRPRIYRTLSDKVCTHPLVRVYTLDPTVQMERRVGIRETPIFVVPAQIFTNHAIVLRWVGYRQRQRSERKNLLIIDEADTILYSSLKTEIWDITPSPEDIEILRMFSPKTRRLTKIAETYTEITKLVNYAYENRTKIKEIARRVKELLDKVDPLLRSFERRRKQIVRYVFENNVRTKVFRMVLTLMELQNVKHLHKAFLTLEKESKGFILYDYDYGLTLLFSPEFPWRVFWKIALSATMPTEKILESEFLSTETKRLLLRVDRRSKTYDNVYVGRITIFESMAGILNRNEEIKYSVPNVLKAIRRCIEKYKEIAGDTPRGVVVWFGNSTQLKRFSELLSKKLPIKPRRSYVFFKYMGVPVFCSYVGSRISRGIDLTNYDISIVVGPLLRPPRPMGFLDVLDFARGVAEAVQSAMRIVRSPRPDRPKLVVLEYHMTTGFYAEFYPEWFKQLYQTHRVQL